MALMLKHNITVLGNVPGDQKAYPTLDLAWSSRRLKLAPGVSLTLQHIRLTSFRSKFGNDFDVLAYSPGALVTMDDLVLEFPLCVAASVVVPGIQRVPRSPRAPPAPDANPSAGKYQSVTTWQGGSYCYTAPGSAGVQCTFDGARYVDVWVEVPVLGDFQGAGGYDAWYHNVTRACIAMAAEECVKTLGAGVCYNNAVFDLQRPKAPASVPAPAPGPRLDIILPTVIVGSLIVICLLALMVWLAIAPGSNVLLMRRRRMSPPRAGAETTIVVTDIEGSSSAWEVLPSEFMNEALSLHHTCMRKALRNRFGTEFATEGDSFLVAFHDPATAIRFAVDVQCGLLEQPWPLHLLQLEGQRPIWLSRQRTNLPSLTRLTSVSMSRKPESGEPSGGLGREDSIVAYGAGSWDLIPGSSGGGAAAHCSSPRGWRRWLGVGSRSMRMRAGPGGKWRIAAAAVDEVYKVVPTGAGSRTFLEQLRDAWESADAPGTAGSPSTLSGGPLAALSLAVARDKVAVAAEEGSSVRGSMPSSMTAGRLGLRDPPVCVFRGLRVRIGMTSGVSQDDICVGDATRKMQYRGQPVAYAKAVCDAGQGGMTLLSAETFQHLSWGADEEAPAVVMHAGDYQPAADCKASWPAIPMPLALYHALVPGLEARLSMIGPLRGIEQAALGTLDAPVGLVTVMFMYAVGHATLSAWNQEVATQAMSVYAETAQRTLASVGGYLVELSGGLCLATFSSAHTAMSCALLCKDNLIVADWPPELLEHELCEVVEVRNMGWGLVKEYAGGRRDEPEAEADGPLTVLMRGIRIRVGIDCSADVHPQISPSTGRMDYRGRVMNRAARIAARAMSGCTMCSEEAWTNCQGGPTDEPRSGVIARRAGSFNLKGVGQLQLYTCHWADGHLGSLQRVSGMAGYSGIVPEARPQLNLHANAIEAERRSQGLQVDLLTSKMLDSAVEMKDAATQTMQDES